MAHIEVTRLEPGTEDTQSLYDSAEYQADPGAPPTALNPGYEPDDGGIGDVTGTPVYAPSSGSPPTALYPGNEPDDGGRGDVTGTPVYRPSDGTRTYISGEPAEDDDTDDGDITFDPVTPPLDFDIIGSPGDDEDDVDGDENGGTLRDACGDAVRTERAGLAHRDDVVAAGTQRAREDTPAQARVIGEKNTSHACRSRSLRRG